MSSEEIGKGSAIAERSSGLTEETVNHNRLRTQFNQRSLCSLDIETIVDEAPEDGSFPPWPLHKCVVASMMTADLDHHGEWAFAVESLRFEEDPQALDRIDEMLHGRSALTMNGSGFDFPVLLLHAQRARKFRLSSLTAAATEPRYWAGRHVDLAEKFSQFGSARGASLERLSKALGIPAKISAHGNEVGELHAAGEIEKIARYCEEDTASTLMLGAYYLAMEAGDPTYHASLVYQFARWCETQGEHLRPYARIDASEELLQLSLIAQLEAGIENARLDADFRDSLAFERGFVSSDPY